MLGRRLAPILFALVGFTLTLAPRLAQAAAGCDCKSQGLSSDPNSYQWEPGGPCIHDPCKELGDRLRSQLPQIGTARFVGCAPTNQSVCPIYFAGLGSPNGITSGPLVRGRGVMTAKYPGCHYATEDNQVGKSVYDAAGQLSNPYTNMQGSASEQQTLRDAMNDYGSPVLCHSWGTGACAANIGTTGNVTYFGGLCPAGATCVVNTGDLVPRLIYNQLVDDDIRSRFVQPPSYPYQPEIGPHLADRYFDPSLANPGEGGVRGPGGWNRTSPLKPKGGSPPTPQCGKPPKPQTPNRPVTPVSDPPYVGGDGDEPHGEASSCTTSGTPVTGRGMGAIGVLGMFGALAWRRRRHRRSTPGMVLPLIGLVLATGASCSSSPGEGAATGSAQQAVVGEAACAGARTECMTACTAPGKATLGVSCSEYCGAMIQRCCVPIDVTKASVDGVCAMEEWLLRAGLKNGDGSNASCGLDRNCDGKDDCSGLATSLCCGDSDCDGKDDCTDDPTLDARCPTPCGDANCDGRDDCNPKLASSACNAAFGGEVAAICNATSGRVAGRVSVGDVDVYAVAATAGQTLQVDVHAVDALQSLLDPVVRLTNSAGATVGSATYTLGADNALSVTAPATDTYYVWIAGSPDTTFSGTGTSQGEYTLGVTVGGTAFTASPRGCADAGGSIGSAQPLVAASTVPAASSPASCAASCDVPLVAAAATMVKIPAGSFASGCKDAADTDCYGDESSVLTYVSEFFIDRTEVTQSAYKQCIDAGACTAPATTTTYFNPTTMPQHPVADVTWYQAAQYCKWAGKRLPTEAEWEKAARGRDGRKYPWGTLAPDCTLANANNCNTKFQAVGSHPTGASPYGVLDMAGNVAEWVRDWYDEDYRVAAPLRDPAGPTEAERFPWDNARYWKVTRGGSYSAGSNTLDDNTLDHLRTSRRSQYSPDEHSPRLGFRCAAGGAACVPRTCADSGQCGVISDGCGGTIDCGGCAAPATCGGGGTPSFCGCTPSATVDCGATWARRFGYNAGQASNSQFDLVTALDATDNVYLLTTVSAVTVNVGGSDLAPIGTSNNAVLAKYDAHGRHQWSIRVGSTGSTSGHALAVDGSGNVFVTGNFTGTTNLGGLSFTSAGSNDVFVAKYVGATGAHVWSKSYGSSGDEYSFGIAADASSGLYVTGYFSGTGNFGGTSLTSAGGTDVFLARLSATDGSSTWSKSFGSTGNDYGIQVRVDASGNAVLGGHFAGSVTFGGTTLASAGGTDVYLAKLSSAGTHVWSMRAGGTGNETLTNIALSTIGDIAITGTYTGAADFGGGALPTYGFYPNMYAAKYTSAGAHVWSRGMGSGGQDAGRAIAFAASGNVVLLAQYGFGALGAPVDAGGGLLPYLGLVDILLAEYDGATGAHVWSKSIGGDDSEEVARGLGIASTGEVVVAARAISTVNFGSGWLTGPRSNHQVVLSRFAPTGPCQPRSCVDAGAECGTISDGCGGTLVCGSCQAPGTCGSGGPNKCGCTGTSCSGATCGRKLDGCGAVLTCGGGRITDTACAGNVSCVETAVSCAAAGATCGQIQNGCGEVYSCGSCSGGTTCGGSGTANTCGTGSCIPKTCALLGKNCGKVSDGCGGVLDCGPCATGECGGGGTPNVCGVCVPQTCTQLGKNCGDRDDGCGGTINCGTCAAPQVCGGGGDGVCGCVAQTCAAHYATCGTIDNGCGGTLDCGTCTGGLVCGANLASINTCCSPTTCAAQGKTCGSISDGCGHVLDCGSCSGSQTCGGGGAANVCGCQPKTCADVSANCGSVPDGCGGTLSCGTCVAPNVCGANNTCSMPWPQIVGGTSIAGVALDPGGNVVVAGIYTAPVTFSPDKSVSTGKGLFVAKYAASGTLLWVKSFEAQVSANVTGLALDGAGDLVVTGGVVGSCDFGGGVTTGYLTTTYSGLFVAKYTGADGSYQWANRFNPTSSTSAVSAAAVATDTTGGVVVTGYLTGSVAIGGTTLSSAGAEDVFVARYQGSNGSHLWSKRFGGTGGDGGNAVATDSSGNIYLTGSFNTSINFGTSGGTNLATAGGADIFVARLTSAGGHSWSKRFGGTSYDGGRGIAVSSAGVVAVTGYFQLTADFGGGALTAAGTDDVFLQSLNASTGAYRWAKRFGDTGADSIGNVVRFAGTDSVVLTGYSMTKGIDLGGGVLPHYSCGQCAAYFIGSYDTAAGTHRWSKGGYDPHDAYPWGMALDASGKVYLAGRTTAWQNETNTFYGVALPKVPSGSGYLQTGFVLPFDPAITCAPTTCAAQGKTCGSIPDACGLALTCGTCTSPSTCGVAGSCCVPTTCAALGKNCGALSDGCGGTLNCGSCGAWPETCGGGGAPPNVCGCAAGAGDGCAMPTLWSRDVGGSAEVESVAVASDGTILEALKATGTGGTVTAYTPGGDQQWTLRAHGADGVITSVVTDDANHAMIAGVDLDAYGTFLERHSMVYGERWTRAAVGGTIDSSWNYRPRVATRGSEVVAGLTVTGTTDVGGGALASGSSSASDVVVAKYRREDGSLLWAKRFGGSDGKSTSILGVAMDGSGNVFIAGRMTGTVSFGGSPLSTYSCGIYDTADVFLVKLGASDGSQQWATQVSCKDGSSAPMAYGMRSDGNGNLVLLGNWAIEARSGATGAVLWSKSIGSNTPWDVTFDFGNNPIVAGALYAPFDFGGGSVGVSAGSAFVVKYAAGSGAHVWSKAHSGGTNPSARAVVMDTRAGSTAVVLAGTSGTGAFSLDLQAYGGPIAANRTFLARLAEPTVACTPNCAGKSCGSDGCGGTCGTCSGTGTCGGTCTTAGTCSYPTTSISCNDSNACTSGDHCDGAGACVSTGSITSCSQTSDGCCPSGCTASNDTNCGYCGDGICSCSEKTSGSCLTDCKKTGKNAFTCGNASCESSETAATCPADCGGGCP